MNRYSSVLRAAEAINYGALTLTLPDGATFICGEEKSPDADMHIRNWKAVSRIAMRGDIGLGESYVENMWDTTDLKSLMRTLARNKESLQKAAGNSRFFHFFSLMHDGMNRNTVRNSRRNIHRHYDLGNNFYRLWLDETMTYSSALFNGNPSLPLAEAQRAKYARILKRLEPGEGDRILEIGCGWGGFLIEAAGTGHHVTGITISEEQAVLARERIGRENLGRLADVRLQDYRDMRETYDSIVSIGMFEHVGEDFWRPYMDILFRTLKPGGRAMIQTIVVPDEDFRLYKQGSDYIRKHVFPGGMLPCPSVFKSTAAAAGLLVTDEFAFGPDYAITLEKWLENFERRLPDVRALGYDETFIRKWRFYLASCMSLFETGKTNVMQFELRK